jgi:hypothetical protein
MKYALLLAAVIWCCAFRIAFGAELRIPHHHAKKVYNKAVVIGKSALPKEKAEGESLSRPIGTP